MRMDRALPFVSTPDDKGCDARANEQLRTVTRDNQTVYYEKVPAAAALPALDGKVLAKPSPVAPLMEELDILPLPHSVRRRMVPAASPSTAQNFPTSPSKSTF